MQRYSYYVEIRKVPAKSTLSKKTANQIDLLFVNGNEFMLWMV